MKCILCNHLSFSTICSTCQTKYLSSNLTKRTLPNGLVVYSFYKYSDIKGFLKTKHTYLGYKIYTLLAKNSFRKFALEFVDDHDKKIYAFAIDDKLSPEYSHTAILTKALKSKYITPKYNKLRAKNTVSYSAKTLEYRLKNPRNFNYTFKQDIYAILVDDIITTGTTLSEAKALLEKNSVNVLFALTLADARQ